MSVYTTLNKNELKPLADRLQLSQINSLDGISAGVVNTNYKVTTNSGQYVLTMVEDPDEADALPFIASLLTYLAKKGIPCPRPVTDEDGNNHFILKNRPTLIASFLTGSSPSQPLAGHCYEIGKMLANIHLAGGDYKPNRTNPMGRIKWATLLEKTGPILKKTAPETLELLLDEAEWLEDNYHGLELPAGLCHGDLFPDNSLFTDGRLTGVIDFFFACNELYIYDLAVARNAWCFDDTGESVPGNWQKLCEGYEKIRPLSTAEKQQLTAAARAAALRFSLSRLFDNHFPRSGETVTKKDPQLFIKRLRYFRQLT
ncbi:MAG: homoserine kinase [Magnetococcales bacterium]|nr:homoserine kinase [Magnetococcales bacterium]